jgi:RNA polymerase sigma-70 factor (ECF subfamily)
MDPNIDVALLEGVNRREIDAYEGLLRRHNQRLFRLARSIVKDDDEAMDIVQETFVTAFDRIADLKEPRAFATWVARIARNESLMRLRKSRRYVHMEEEQLEQTIESSESGAAQSRPDREVANQQLGKLLEVCIDELPVEFRTVFVMRSIEGCSTRATADILEIKEATVKTRLHRAKKLLQDRVSACSDIAATTVHEFAGHRCDTIVRNVLSHLRSTW